MAPKISICRKGEDLYLKFMGDVTPTSSSQVLLTLKKLVLASLACSPPGSQVSFTFKTHGKVDLETTMATQEA